ncbi:tetratricopeptide repeat protein [Limnohabitans sp.]|jgi:tetratricopeptide (TPR) repeat protein|uniref:tetratricopeptide repeat protein n=1 Tax=Limnohabitans sp. TaxID=1907725 RepID=UPI002898EA99|nr:tetratricopeptide repeat protein [Limnohabitans sp.]
MHSLLPVVLSCLLLAFSAGVKADVYSDVNRLVVSEQWAKAQTQAEQHLKSQPTDPQMRLLLSRIQDGLGQTAAAMETLQALTQSFPELPEPHNNLAALLARQNRYAEALTALQAAVRARPDYALAQENLGDVYIALAIEAYQNASKAPAAQPRAANKRLAAEQLLKASAP